MRTPQHVLRCPLSNKLHGVVNLFRAGQKDQDVACDIVARSVSQGGFGIRNERANWLPAYLEALFYGC